MLEYYLPGLDASKLSERQFINKVAWLKVIREMEQANKIEKVINKLYGEQ